MTASDDEIVAAVRDVPGVSAAAIEPTEGDGPGVLRLSLQPGADETAVAEEVAGVLRERFGLGIDADRIRLVDDVEDVEDVEDVRNVGDVGGVGDRVGEPTADRRDGRRPRPAIQRMQLVSQGLAVGVEITLVHRDRTIVGESSGTATTTGVHRAVAAATLHAVEQLVDDRVRFELDYVEVSPSGRDQTALVTLTMLTPAGGERLTGAAMVREDGRQAVIRATLDAVNRRVERLLRDAS